MRFGPLPVEEAGGAILAHSVRRGEVSLKKGHRLRPADLEALTAAGASEVIAARLAPDDVHEDEAARAIAEAIGGPGLEVEKPFTGRVNLRAQVPGLLVLDRARVDALNLVDESVTLATLEPLAALEARQMVATVKIIPFAVPRSVLERCLEVVRGAAPLMSLAAYRPRTVTLIQTRLAGTKETVLDKTVTVTAGRLAAIGSRLLGEARSPHEVAPLARQIEASEGDLILIAGASAITDRRDVLPTAIEAAGGRVHHFGMPVDPGNLLLLGEHRGRPVLGLPGCARSPKLNGFDWVLQRLAADLEVGPREIMGMGVGGLLAEIPSRPQPRAGRSGSSGKVAGLLLAAGQSRRMGMVNKLLVPIEAKPMVAHVADGLLGCRARPVVAVTGHEADAVRRALGERQLTIVHNPDYAEGLSTSLKVGLDALPDEIDGVLVALGDMPRLTSAQFDRLIAAFNPTEGRSIVVPTVRGKRGNPVLFATRFAGEIAEIQGDVGARHLIGAHAEEVVEIAMDDDAALTDVDTPAALEALAGARPAPA